MLDLTFLAEAFFLTPISPACGPAFLSFTPTLHVQVWAGDLRPQSPFRYDFASSLLYRARVGTLALPNQPYKPLRPLSKG